MNMTKAIKNKVCNGGLVCVADTYDVVVIGGGPAGMMAAGRAAERGRTVLLLEKNPTLGKKLLITGGGRCNVTNNTPNVRAMLAKYGESGKFLFSAFAQFGVIETLRFFNDRGMGTKEEAEGRVFPASNKAQSVWDVLIRYMKKNGVVVLTQAEVAGIVFDKFAKQTVVTLTNRSEVRARACIVATGGTSRPETGSTGEGFLWLKKLGHTILENDVALVPIALKDSWTKKLAGITLKDVKLTTFLDDARQKVYKGKLLFTHAGISGPTVLNMSRDVGDLLHGAEGSEYARPSVSEEVLRSAGPNVRPSEERGSTEDSKPNVHKAKEMKGAKMLKTPEAERQRNVVIMLDVFPALDGEVLWETLRTLLIKQSNKKIKNTLSAFIFPAFVDIVLVLARIDGETPNHSVRSAQRKALGTVLKAIPLHVAGLLGRDKAVVSSGGVALAEVNFKTMQSRVVPALFVVGDALHINRPSGGYSLQVCWTTGYVAGNCT